MAGFRKDIPDVLCVEYLPTFGLNCMMHVAKIAKCSYTWSI